jgi:uncharacterized protein (TIGR02466 family)
MSLIPIPLFPVNLVKLKMRNHSKIKKYLMDTVYPQYVRDGVNDKLTNAYTDYVPGAAKVPWMMLTKFYDEDVKEFLKHTGIDFDQGWSYKITCWYGMMHNSTSQFVHDHTGGPKTIQWSAVHYVVLDDKNSGTVFLNPNARMMKSVIPTKNRNHLPAMYYPIEEQVLVEEGDMVFFPAWLDHHTPAHTTDNLRAVVAMNIMLTFDNVEGY